MEHHNNLQETLLQEKTKDEGPCNTTRVLILLFVVGGSSLGMITLKYAQLRASMGFLTLGYALEGLAIALYPVSMRYFPLHFVAVAWAAGSNLTALVGGYVLFCETAETRAIVGVACNVVGVALVASSLTP